jgi:Elongation factor G, domain IV
LNEIAPPRQLNRYAASHLMLNSSMEQNRLFEDWLQRKLNHHHYFHLREPMTVDYEYKTALGHPSSYAYVRFDCQPAHELTFQSTAKWPSDLSPEWIDALEGAVTDAVVDGLVCSSWTPFIGCSITLVESKHDEISSSPESFYRATRAAMVEFTKDTLRRWQIWPLDYLGGIGGNPVTKSAA